MDNESFLYETVWDKIVLKKNTFEITEYSEKALRYASQVPGHYTIKVDPLVSKKLLNEYGFYYCDTLIEPFCKKKDFKNWPHNKVEIKIDAKLDDLLSISNGAFEYGRFHRDFNVEREAADARYDNWLKQLYLKKQAFGIVFEKKIASFFAFHDSKILLHAVSKDVRGQGLAKYLWSAGCLALYEHGYDELTSSVSAANTSVLNLYISLGFRFRTPVDVYHATFE